MEIIEMKNETKTQRRLMKLKVGSLKRMTTIEKPLARLIEKIRENVSQITKIRNERKHITTGAI